MCGIAGFIGKSKNPSASFELITNLFAQLETRGTDASGMWGLENKEHPSIIYHKAPLRSSKFVELPIWRGLQKLNPNLLLVHARKTSLGVGNASNNSNNHPFVSANKKIGLIHNGRIHEVSFLKEKYELKTECDSEVLLRMFESAIDQRVPINNDQDTPDYLLRRMAGLYDIWSVVREGSMATVIGELYEDGSRSIFLFRNDKRPLWIGDLRATLGQVFFFSSIEIWFNAVNISKNLRDIGDIQKIAELPTEEIWHFKIDKNNQIVTEDNFHRFGIQRIENEKKWDIGSYRKIVESEPENLIVTELDEKEEAPSSQKSITVGYDYWHNGELSCYKHGEVPPCGVNTFRLPTQTFNSPKSYDLWDDDWEDDPKVIDLNDPDYLGTTNSDQRDIDLYNASMQNFQKKHGCENHGMSVVSEDLWDSYESQNANSAKAAIADVEERCQTICQMVNDIEVTFRNMIIENELNENHFRDVYESLNNIVAELKGTNTLINQ